MPSLKMRPAKGKPCEKVGLVAGVMKGTGLRSRLVVLTALDCVPRKLVSTNAASRLVRFQSTGISPACTASLSQSRRSAYRSRSPDAYTCRPEASDTTTSSHTCRSEAKPVGKLCPAPELVIDTSIVIREPA